MRLTAWEEERLLIFTAAELARRHRAAGLLLNQPEAVALICDAMFEAARAGVGYGAVEAAGRSAVRPDEVMDGVAALIDEIRLEVLLGDGTRLVVLVDPLGAGVDAAAPGAIVGAREAVAEPAAEPARVAGEPAGERRTLLVRNGSTRVVRVSSHYPFERVNQRLELDRAAAAGFRLDLPAGASLRWAPGETHEVTLVRYGGRLGASGRAGADRDPNGGMGR